MDYETKRRIAFGGTNIYGPADLEADHFKFWMNPNPMVYNGGRALCAFAFENEPWGREGQVSWYAMLETLQNLMNWYHIGSITFQMNRSRFAALPSQVFIENHIALRFQCAGYADYFEVRRG